MNNLGVLYMSIKTKMRNFDFIRESLDFLKILHFPYQVCAPLFDLHHKYVIRHLDKWFHLAACCSRGNYIKNENKSERLDKNIWFFWWQGETSMPNIVRMCLKSVYKHASNHKVIFITKKNVKEYAKLPRYIYDLISSGNISLTNFSDILEFNLLRNYGGLWIDATVYCVNDLPSRCFNNLYTASGGYIKYHNNIAMGHWTGFLFGGDAQQPLFVYMNNFFKIYWKYNKYLFDYFLIDYALNYAYKHNIGKFRNYGQQILKSNPYIFRMQNYLNDQYNPILYNKFIRNAPLFKLTYKKKFKKNENTLYNVLLKKNI